MPTGHYLSSVAGHDALLVYLRDLLTNQNAISVAINAGGTGYTVGDILTVSGGTAVNGLVAELEVTSVSAGVIDGVRVYKCGAYSSTPANPVSVTGGTGSSATFNLTFETQVWTVNRDEAPGTTFLTSASFDSCERELMLQGPGNAGADEIYIMLASATNNARSAYNWAISGATGFDTNLDWNDQPGNSWAAGMRSYVPLTNGTIEAWLYVHPRYFMGVARIGSTYSNFFGGFLNIYATPTEYPYPIYLSGCSTRYNALPGDSGPVGSGLTDPGAYSGTDGSFNGPATLRSFDGVWNRIYNWYFNGTSRINADQDNAIVVNPCQYLGRSGGQVRPADGYTTGLDWGDIIPGSGVPGTPVNSLLPTPNTGQNLPALFPNAIIELSLANGRQIYGEIPDLYWFPTNELNIVSQDRIVVNGVYHRAFQNMNRGDAWAYFAIREDN